MKSDSRDLLGRGVVEVIEKSHLEEALKGGKKLRIKYGADPTAPDLHLGHSVGLKKLKEFQDLGHKIVFIIGDYTAQIGDPSGKSKTRPMLSSQEVKKNAKTYFEQVGKILDAKKIEIRYNSEWFNKENLASLIRLMSKFTMQRILERDDFEKRLKSGTEIYAHEILYPMMQAYDSIMVKADVELGGADQKFNMLAGRDLQRRMGEPEQDIVMIPLLIGLDGQRKMSKSLGNYIGITEKPDAMFGKIMSIPDELIDQYYDLCTDKKREIKDPREAKLELAQVVVSVYHGKKAGEKARQEFIRVVSNKEIPWDIPSFKIKSSNLNIIDLLVETKLSASKSEAKRLVGQGGVKFNGKKQTDAAEIIGLKNGDVIQVGKIKFVKIVV